MGNCTSCNAHDADELPLIDATYTPQRCLLSESPEREVKKSEVKVPIIKRKVQKRASTAHVQALEFFGPVLRHVTSQEGGGALSFDLKSISRNHDTNPGLEDMQSDLQPDFPLVEDACRNVPSGREESENFRIFCKCLEGHKMRKVSKENMPYDSQLERSDNGGVPLCDGCSNRNLQMTEYFQCSQCKYHLCLECAKIPDELRKKSKSSKPNIDDIRATENLDRLRNFHTELDQMKRRIKSKSKRLQKQERDLLSAFEQNDHVFLSSVRKRVFMFLSQAYEIDYQIDQRLLEAMYTFYSKGSVDINEQQMCTLLQQCYQSFAQVCDDAIQEAKKRKRKNGKFITDSFVEELETSSQIYKDLASDVSLKNARRVRKRFGPQNNIITMETFCANFGFALFEDQMNMQNTWKKVLKIKTLEEFLQTVTIGLGD